MISINLMHVKHFEPPTKISILKRFEYCKIDSFHESAFGNNNAKIDEYFLDPEKLLHNRYVLTISMDICFVTTSPTLTLLNPLSSNVCHQVRSFFY